MLRRRRFEFDLLGRQQIILEHILGDIAGIKALRDFELVSLRFDLAAQLVGLESGGADHVRAGNFRRDIRHQGVAADAQHIVGLPGVGPAVGEFEFDGQRPLAALHLGDVGVHAIDKGADPLPRIRGVGGPFLLHVAAIQEQACRAVLIDIGRTQ